MAITNKDIEKLSGIFSTKGELKTDISNLRNEILSSNDKIMKKLEDISIEQKMSFAQYKRHDEKIDDHEKRIKTLEVKVA